MVLSTTESYDIRTSTSPIERLMQSTLNIALDTFGEFEIIEDCQTDVAFDIEDMTIPVSQGRYIDFGLFTYLDSNGDCR